MKDHLLILAGFSFAVLIMTWLPSVSRKARVSYPIILLLVGFGMFYGGIPIDWPDPLWSDSKIISISELIVVVSLMTAGLKIPTSKSFTFWKIPIKLLLIAMPITMDCTYFLGVYLIGLSFTSALLLAAVLAPTDPVLAAAVQLSSPEDQDAEHSKVKFALTAEAGLNDGMAFPFTFLAVLIIQAGSWEAFDLTGWIMNEFLLKIFLGSVFGYLFAKIIIYFNNYMNNLGIKTDDGLLALSMAIFIYSSTELLHGYGFLAVFIAGITLKKSQLIKDVYKNKLHGFLDEVERFMLVIWITIFGGSIMNGIMGIASWKGFFFALILLFLIRPIAGFLSLLGCNNSTKDKMIIGFFGIRGIGSIFYISWAFKMIGTYQDRELLYSILAIVILCSIFIHGVTAPLVFRKKNNS